MRLSRPCYDKIRRCPGWAGGGTRYPKGPSRCRDGHIAIAADPQGRYTRGWRWRFWPCDTCDVVIWPYMVRWVDWRWWRWEIQGWPGMVGDRLDDWLWRRRNRRDRA